MSHWQLLLTAPDGSAKSLGHLRGGAALLPPTSLVSDPWLRGSMRQGRPRARDPGPTAP